jgi:magnesium chelatase family protein
LPGRGNDDGSAPANQKPDEYEFWNLFLDELPEFGSKNLETLRQPLEDRVVTISRASGSLTFPANFVLVAALNPCPCGYFQDDRQECTCSMSMVQRYQKRISGPLMDRIDIHLELKRVPFQKLTDMTQGETSAVIRQRVEAARQIQAERFAPLNKPYVLVNGDMGPAEVQMFCLLDETGKNLMRAAVQQMNLSARAYHRVLKLARTIADLANIPEIQAVHLAEALQYRPREAV